MHHLSKNNYLTSRLTTNINNMSANIRTKGVKV